MFVNRLTTFKCNLLESYCSSLDSFLSLGSGEIFVSLNTTTCALRRSQETAYKARYRIIFEFESKFRRNISSLEREKGR